MSEVLGIVTRALASHLIRAAGYPHATAQTGAVTLLQRFASAPNLSIHSSHAGVACAAHERAKLDRLCHYITRSAVATERASLTAQGKFAIVSRPLSVTTPLRRWCGHGAREHRRSGREYENTHLSRAARRGYDARVQIVCPRGAATKNAGPAGIKLTATPSIRTDARLV